MNPIIVFRNRLGVDPSIQYIYSCMYPFFIFCVYVFSVLQLSLKNSLNVAEHQEIGEALSELGKEGILVIGSGFMTHTFEKMGQLTEDIFPWASEFQRWVHEVFCDPQLTPRERKERMSDCESLPFFKKAHPRTEHFMPLIMASAAAEYTPGKPIFSRFVSPSLLMEHIIFRPHSL